MRKIFVLLTALSPLVASALDVAGVRLDDKTNVAGQELTLNGAGVRVKVFFKVYVAGLYLPRKEPTALGVLAQPGPRRVLLVTTRDLTSEQLLEGLNGGLADNNTPAELDAIKSEIDQMRGYFGAIKAAGKGSVIALDYVATSGTTISFNSQVLGMIPGETFNRALLKVWLGENPVDRELKRALLGAAAP
jgi:hypothetical protein